MVRKKETKPKTFVMDSLYMSAHLHFDTRHRLSTQIMIPVSFELLRCPKLSKSHLRGLYSEPLD